MESAKLIIEVVAGIIPQQPMPEYTRRFFLLSKEFHEGSPQEREAAWNRVHGEALMYMLTLQQPRSVNWVRMDWLWL